MNPSLRGAANVIASASASSGDPRISLLLCSRIRSSRPCTRLRLDTCSISARSSSVSSSPPLYASAIFHHTSAARL